MTEFTHDINLRTKAFEINSNTKKSGGERISKISRNRAYWISQSSGWAVYAAANLIALYSFETFTWQKALLFIFVCLMGIASTHYLRITVKRNGWLELPLKKIIPRVLISSLIIGIILSAIILSDKSYRKFL